MLVCRCVGCVGLWSICEDCVCVIKRILFGVCLCVCAWCVCVSVVCVCVCVC